MMAVIGSLQHAAQLAADAFVQAPAEDLRDALGAQAQQAQITGALEQPVDGEVAPEDQVAAVLDLLDGIVTAEIDRVAVFFWRTWDRRLGVQYSSRVRISLALRASAAACSAWASATHRKALSSLRN